MKIIINSIFAWIIWCLSIISFDIITDILADVTLKTKLKKKSS